MPRRRIQPTHLNTDLPEPLQYRFLETTNRARPAVVDDVKVEDLKRARRGRPLFEQFEKERGTRTSIEETDVSLAGRREYLKTMDKPDALIIESLHKTVFKPHFDAWQRFLVIESVQPRTANEAYADVPLSPELYARPYKFSEMVHVFDDQGSAAEPTREALKALVAWGRQHQHRNEWLWDAAIHTIRVWLVDDIRPRTWQYWPEQLLQTFHPTFGAWVPGPGGYSRKQVRKLWTARFEKQLSVYLDDVETVDLSRVRDVSRDLEIAVLYEQGKSPAQIRRLHKGLSLSRIGKIIERILDRIGHQPRPPKGGKNASRTLRPRAEPADGPLDQLCRAVDEYSAKSLQKPNQR